MNRPKKILFARLFAGLLILLGVLQIAATLTGYRNAKTSPNWPETEAIITKSRMVGTGSGITGGFRTRIRYNYVVNEQTFEGRRVTYGRVRGFRSKEHAQLLADRYPTGSRVVAYHHPVRRNVSVLEPGPNHYPLAFSLFAGLFMASAGALIWIRPLPRR